MSNPNAPPPVGGIPPKVPPTTGQLVACCYLATLVIVAAVVVLWLGGPAVFVTYLGIVTGTVSTPPSTSRLWGLVDRLEGLLGRPAR